MGPSAEDRATIAAYGRVADAYGAALAGDLAHKPYDRARLDVVAGAAVPGLPLLDAGCGPGQAAGYLAKCGAAVLGVDASLEMVRAARLRHPEIDFYAMDLRALAFADRTFGGLVARYSLIHLQREAMGASLAELARVLAPRAPLLLTLYDGEGTASVPAGDGAELGESVPVTLYKRKEIEALLTSTGRFDGIRIEGRRPYPSETQLWRIFAFATLRAD